MCNSGSTCSLNLALDYIVTTPDAPLIIANGNVGSYLSPDGFSTFVSRDAGLSILIVKARCHLDSSCKLPFYF